MAAMHPHGRKESPANTTLIACVLLMLHLPTKFLPRPHRDNHSVSKVVVLWYLNRLLHQCDCPLHGMAAFITF